MSASDQPRPPVPPPSGGAPGAPASRPGAPASPPTKPWWQRGWGAAIIGVVGLLVGAGAGVGVAATGHTKTVTTANTTTVTTAKTATAVRPGQVPAHTETHIVTRTVTTTVARLEPTHTVAPKPTTFSGSGRKNLGSVTIPRESAILWHASGGHFSLRSVPEGMALEVKETGTSGKAVVANGTFEHLEVIATGPWSFTISPNG